jgi:hypothetical protein
MKKVFALLLVCVFAFCMVGCGDDDEDTCTPEGAQACLDNYNACDAGDPAACATNYCTCLEGLGCDTAGTSCADDAGL